MQPLKHKMIQAFTEYLGIGLLHKNIVEHDMNALSTMALAKEYVLDAPFAQEDMIDLVREADTLNKFGLLRPPFDHIVLQTTYGLQQVLVFCSVTQKLDGIVMGVIPRNPADVNNGKDGWYTTGMGAHVVPGGSIEEKTASFFTESVEVLKGSTGLSDPMEKLQLEANIRKLNGDIHVASVMQMLCFLAFLNFPRVRSETIPRPDGLNKARRQKGKVEVDEVRVVKVKEHFRHSDGTKTKSSTHPTQPQRLHIVRGHVRNQAHGPKWSLHRAIWVKPFFVGDKSAGEVEVAHYEVSTERKKQ